MPTEAERQAVEYLLTAVIDLDTVCDIVNGNRHPVAALFHCQQAVEKALKAFLTFHGSIFEKTHDLGILCSRCEAVDPAFARFWRHLNPLTVFAVRTRYPSASSPTEDDMWAAFPVVSELWAFVLERLPDSVRCTPDIAAVELPSVSWRRLGADAESSDAGRAVEDEELS